MRNLKTDSVKVPHCQFSASRSDVFLRLSTLLRRICSDRKLWMWLFGGLQKFWSVLWGFRGLMQLCRYQACDRCGGPPTQHTSECELMAHSLSVWRVVALIPKDVWNVHLQKLLWSKKGFTKDLNFTWSTIAINQNVTRCQCRPDVCLSACGDQLLTCSSPLLQDGSMRFSPLKTVWPLEGTSFITST